MSERGVSKEHMSYEVFGFLLFSHYFVCIKFALQILYMLYVLTISTWIVSKCFVCFLADDSDLSDKQRRKITASGEAVSLFVQNLRPGEIREKINLDWEFFNFIISIIYFFRNTLQVQSFG